MADINDFKILNTKCRTYFNMLENELGKTISVPSEKHKERFGFYLFILETLCNIRDLSDIVKLISDQEFNSIVFNRKDEDYGLDAVFIDKDENNINLFNFKFRDSFNAKMQSINETFLTTKFTNAIITKDISKFSGKIHDFADEIIKLLNGNEVWKLRLFVVSNETVEINVESPEIKHLKELYGLEVTPLILDDIKKIMSLRPNPIDAIIHINKDSILPFTENSLSSSKSYIIRIGANDLLRMTCNNKVLRENYMIEDFSCLFDTDMDYDLLFDNVRGFITRSKFNENLAKTLQDEPSKFFLYNNGLTITANDIIAEETNANQKMKITIKDFQVVNGGQTLRAIHNFKQKDKNNITDYLSKCEILVRVFKTSTENSVRNKIAEYTNSQNAISSIDLKSLSTEQIQIEQYLDSKYIIYSRKAGDTGISSLKSYKHKISMEKFGQILFALQGSPEKASNQKKQIFEKYYNSVFKSSNFDLTKSAEIISRYFEIKKEYESLEKYYSSDQKIFFILYIDDLLDIPLKEKIDFFEESLRKYNSAEKDLPEVRKLLQVTFRQQLKHDIDALNLS